MTLRNLVTQVYLYFFFSVLQVACPTAHGQANVSPSKPSRLATPSAVVRDTGAITLLKETLSKLGGLPTLREKTDWKIDATIAPAGAGVSHPVRFEAAGDEYRIEHHAPGASNPTSFLIITSGNGKPSRKAAGAATYISPLLSHALIIGPLAPRTLQRQLEDANYTIKDLGPSTDGTQEMILTENHATLLDEQVSPQTWYIDKTTFLPAKVIVYVPNPTHTRFHSSMEISFSDYRKVEGIMIPYQTSRLFGGVVRDITTVTVVDFRKIDHGRFAPQQ